MATPFRRPDRREDRRDPRLPPGQYDAGADWPVLTAEVTPRLDADRLDVPGRRAGAADAATWTWDEAHGAAGVALRRRHPLRHHLVEVRHVVLGGVASTTLLAAAAPPPEATHVRRLAHTGYTTNLPLARRHRRAGLDRLGARGEAAAGRARRPGAAAGARTCTSGRAPSGSRAARCSTTTSRASGSRTATTPAATPGRSSGTPVTDPSPAAPCRRCRHCPPCRSPPARADDRAGERRPPPGGARRSGRRRRSPRSAARPRG